MQIYCTFTRIVLFLALGMALLPLAASAADTNIFTGDNAEAAIAGALAKAGAGDDIKALIREVRPEEEMARADTPISAEVDNLQWNKEQGSWKATMLFTADGRNLPPISLSGTYEEMVQIPVLKRQVRSGEIITGQDIDLIRQPVRRLRGTTITDAQDLTGKSPRHVISQNRPIRRDEIAAPSVLFKGARVTMLYKARNLEIRTIGEALENGAKGDVVKIRNLASKAVVDGIVETSDRVRVNSPENNAAEAGQ